MTNKEYISAYLGKYGVTDDEVTLLLMEQGITPDAEADTTNLSPLKVAMYNWLPGMIAGLQNITEGGYSITWNVDGLKTWISWLAGQLGLSDPYAAKVRNRSNLW